MIDELAQLSELVNGLGAGTAGVLVLLLIVLVFGIYAFIRIMQNSSKSNLEVMDKLVNQNLQVAENIQKFALGQEKKRDDTQTSLDGISKQLLDTSIEFERFKAHHESEVATYKTRADALDDNVKEYRKQCSETVKTVMAQVEQASAREKRLQHQIDSLIEQTKTLSTQNSDLMHIVSTLRDENDRLKAERAKFELATAKTIARMEARLQLLDMKGNNHEQSERNITNHVKQDSSSNILDSSSIDNSD